MRLLIDNVRIILEEGIIKNHGVIVDGDTIEKIFFVEEDMDYEVDRRIDGQGMYLAPGFIDIHTHGNSGYDTMDATPEAIASMARYYLKNGVTTFLATTVTNPEEKLDAAIRTVVDYQNDQDPSKEEATLGGIYFEGPYFNVKKKGAQPEKDIRKPDLERMKTYVDLSKGAIKAVALAPELDGALDLVSYLKEKGIKSAIAHTDANYEETKKGIDEGMTIATHLYNGMRGFTHREPGTAGAILTDERVMGELIVDGVHLHPAAVDLAVKAKGTKRLVLISDSMRAAGLEDGKYDLGGQEVTVKDGAAHLPEGTIAGSTLNLNKAVKNVIRDNGIPIEEAVRMASTNPAKAIGMFDTIGSIYEGKKADMVLFDDEVNLHTVIKRGHVFPMNNDK